MKNSPSSKPVLLDTSFLLPTLGIDVGEPTLDILMRLQKSQTELCYSDLSLLECLWVTIKEAKHRDFDDSVFKAGILSITRSGRYRQVQCDDQACIDALRMHRLGHTDTIDNMLYAIALNSELQFLTLDNELRTFIENHDLPNVLVQPGLP